MEASKKLVAEEREEGRRQMRRERRVQTGVREERGGGCEIPWEIPSTGFGVRSGEAGGNSGFLSEAVY